MDREACHTVVHGITKSHTQLSDWAELIRGKNMKKNRYLYLYQISWNVKDADGGWFWPSRLQSTEAWSLPQPKTLNEHVCKFTVLVTHSCLTLCNLMDHQVPLSMGFSRQEYWSGLPFPSPGDLPDPRIKLTYPALSGGFFTSEPLGKPNVQ